MGKIIKTWTENETSAAASSWTMDFIGTDITVTGSTFNLSTPQVRAKYSGSGKGYANTHANIYNIKIGGKAVPATFGWMWSNTTKSTNEAALASGTVTTLSKRTSYDGISYESHTKSLSTQTYFDRSNNTTKTLNVVLSGYELYGRSQNANGGASNMGTLYSQSGNLGTISTVTLNAPPTFTKSSISYSPSGRISSNLTTASVTLSSLSAKYGGYIKKIEFFFGTQSVSKSFTSTPSSAQTLSVVIKDVGTFYPKVRVTDSRGQTTTESYSAVTVTAYNAPTASFTVKRVDSNGIDADSGTNALITLNETWTNDSQNHLAAPTVIAKDSNNTAVSFTQTWYTNRASDGTLSGQISDWSTVTSMPVYCLASGAFNANQSYTISVTPKDNYKSGKVVNQKLASEFYTIDFLAGGKGIAFGQPATEEGFHCSMNAIFNGEITKTTTTGNSVFVAERPDSETSIMFGVGSGGTNHGVYSNKNDNWMVAQNETGNVYLGGITTDHLAPGNIYFKSVKFSSLFVIETHAYKTNNLTITSGSSLNETTTITKAGYKPIGVVGWRGWNGTAGGSGGSHINPYAVYLSSSSVGSGTLLTGISAVGGAISKCSFTVDVLWVRDI